MVDNSLGLVLNGMLDDVVEDRADHEAIVWEGA